MSLQVVSFGSRKVFRLLKVFVMTCSTSSHLNYRLQLLRQGEAKKLAKLVTPTKISYQDFLNMKWYRNSIGWWVVCKNKFDWFFQLSFWYCSNGRWISLSWYVESAKSGLTQIWSGTATGSSDFCQWKRVIVNVTSQVKSLTTRTQDSKMLSQTHEQMTTWQGS